jgi:hypothetical protein
MRHFRIALALLGGHGNQQAIGMIGERADQPPFFFGKFRPRRAAPRRLLALAHGGEIQGEDAAELRF